MNKRRWPVFAWEKEQRDTHNLKPTWILNSAARGLYLDTTGTRSGSGLLCGATLGRIEAARGGERDTRGGRREGWRQRCVLQLVYS